MAGFVASSCLFSGGGAFEVIDFFGCEREVSEVSDVSETVLCFWREIGFVRDEREKKEFMEDLIEGLD